MLGTFEDDIVLETGDAELDDIERRLAAGEDPEEVLKGWGDGAGGKTKLNDPLNANKKENEEKRADEEDFEDDYRLSEEPQTSRTTWARKE